MKSLFNFLNWKLCTLSRGGGWGLRKLWTFTTFCYIFLLLPTLLFFELVLSDWLALLLNAFPTNGFAIFCSFFYSLQMLKGIEILDILRSLRTWKLETTRIVTTNETTHLPQTNFVGVGKGGRHCNQHLP